MPERRQNFMTKEWVVIATERAKRPDQMAMKGEAKPAVSFSEKCPFCPGHESQTPPRSFVSHTETPGRRELCRTSLRPFRPNACPSARFTLSVGRWADSASMT